ncbi:hypothetical protein [Microbulbifer sp. VAAF005]|uniref:hypothetical protein n=1 Tax=Microbulbifer sp. VAAF005 TaxID=3034230 RepID=UPI0024ADF3DD|nr:hypothetical protein [Microbulbifer sp. VAAF005]WHI46320.1 hypothetical protein P0078_21795 [Microbulbifer sp. VAAF005]
MFQESNITKGMAEIPTVYQQYQGLKKATPTKGFLPFRIPNFIVLKILRYFSHPTYIDTVIIISRLYQLPFATEATLIEAEKITVHPFIIYFAINTIPPNMDSPPSAGISTSSLRENLISTNEAC